MIYSRFGGEIRILRLATAADHRAAGETPIRESDRERMRQGCRVVFEFVESRQDMAKRAPTRVADVSYLRADNGWGEIQDAIAAVTECRGHAPGTNGPQGETVYCDGSCRRHSR